MWRSERGKGGAAGLSFTVAHDVAHGHLVHVTGPQVTLDAVWRSLTLLGQAAPSAAPN